MILRVNGEYLEYEGDLEIERHVKLFEQLVFIRGDFSYQDSFKRTENNDRIIGYFGINNTNKPWKIKIPTEVLTDSGVDLHSGFIRIESIDDIEYRFSFFSGNQNWIDELSEPANSFNISTFDTRMLRSNIISTFSKTSGVVFPLVDNGTLSTRVENTIADIETEFHPFIYVKDAIESILNKKGIKIKGDCLSDPLYQKLITSNNSQKGLDRYVNDRIAYIGKNSNQVIALTTSYQKVTFTNTSGLYSNSINNNWETAQSRYVFDIDTKKVKVDLVFIQNFTVSSGTIIGTTAAIRIILNGTDVIFQKQYTQSASGSSATINVSDTFEFESYFVSGDYIELQVYGGPAAVISSQTVLQGSSIKITPIKFFKVISSSLLPSVSASSFIGNIFNVCGLLASYNDKTKTINTVSYDSLLKADPIDISEYVNIDSLNFTEFADDYAKSNRLLYTDQDSVDIEEYNKNNKTPYGGGILEVENDFLEPEKDILELGFVAANQKSIPAFGTSLPQTFFKSLEDGETFTVTSVSDLSGSARFNISNPDGLNSIIVRISDSTVPEYNGDHVVFAETATYVTFDATPYLGSATATLTVLTIKDEDNDEQILLVHEPNKALSQFTAISSINEYYLGVLTDVFTSLPFAYFYRSDSNTVYDSTTKEALFFDRIEGSNISLIDARYSGINNVINKGVKLICTATMPENVYRSIDFTRPLRIKSNNLNSLFLLNKDSGYKGSHLPFRLELIQI